MSLFSYRCPDLAAGLDAQVLRRLPPQTALCLSLLVVPWLTNFLISESTGGGQPWQGVYNSFSKCLAGMRLQMADS